MGGDAGQVWQPECSCGQLWALPNTDPHLLRGAAPAYRCLPTGALLGRAAPCLQGWSEVLAHCCFPPSRFICCGILEAGSQPVKRSDGHIEYALQSTSLCFVGKCCWPNGPMSPRLAGSRCLHGCFCNCGLMSICSPPWDLAKAFVWYKENSLFSVLRKKFAIHKLMVAAISI